jgi:chromate transporter
LLAGLGFMLPGFVLMLLLAWAYTRLGIAGGLIGALFVGVQAAVLAVVLRATFKIGEHILAGVWLWATAIGAVLAMLAGASFWIVLAASGGAYVLASARRYVWVAVLLLLAAGLALWLGWNPAAVAEATRTAPTAGGLFWSGLKAGLLTFGGAYTAIPFIRGDTVGRGWMTDAQFLDGIGLSGMLPAPLVIFSTFVGWISGGLAGALAMTAGMFLPAFAFSLLLYERLELVVEHKSLQRFLAGVAAGVVGLIAFTLLDLARSTADRSPDLLVTVAIFAAALVLVVQWKSKFAPPAAVVLGGVAALLLLGLG